MRGGFLESNLIAHGLSLRSIPVLSTAYEEAGMGSAYTSFILNDRE